jgi:hypothetical protein
MTHGIVGIWGLRFGISESPSGIQKHRSDRTFRPTSGCIHESVKDSRRGFREVVMPSRARQNVSSCVHRMMSLRARSVTGSEGIDA